MTSPITPEDDEAQGTGASALPSGSRAAHEAPTGLHPSGFDPSRGIARQTLVNIGRDCVRYHDGADINAEIVGMIREASERVTGGNCTFADDDLAILAHLAERAVDAGLTDKLHPNVQRAAAIAMETREKDVG